MALLAPPLVLVAVVAIALSGQSGDSRAAPGAASAASARTAVVIAAVPSSEPSVSRPTPSPRSDWPAAIGGPRVPAERVNKFTIDDVLAPAPAFDTTPLWVRRLGALSNYRVDPYEG